MKQVLLVTIAALSACGEGRERRVLSIDSTLEQPDLTLPDTVTLRDTSVTVATRGEPQASVGQAAKPAPTPAKATPPARRTRPKPPPETPPADSSVQAYAPGASGDSTPSAKPPVDSTPIRKPAPDTVSSAAATDTVTTSPIETAAPTVAATSPTPVDTAAPRRAAATAARTADTAARAADTAAVAGDTASTPAVDTMVEPPAPLPAQPSRPAADLAARTLPVGTEIHAQLNDSITSRRDTVGQIVSAHVMQNVVGPTGRTLIPAGAQVRFTITRLRPSRSKGSQGRLGLRADSIALNGQLETVQAETRPVPRELRGRGVTTGDAAKVGGGAAAGAVIGGVVGDAKGAVIGGVAGAAAGAVVANQTATRDVVVKAKTPVVFVLTAPLVAP
jgi:hypothetical protein